MRLLFVLLAGAVGWLWYASRAPGEAPPPPPPQVRHADLTGLGAQVAAARSARIPAIELPTEQIDEPELAEAYEEEVEPDLADLAEQAQLAIYDRPPPADAIDLSAHVDHSETIVIEGHAPIIDVTSVSCGGIHIEYTKHIPVPGRTFESALGTPNPGHTFENVDGAAIIDGEVVTISSGSQVENEYIIEDVLDQPAIDQAEHERIEEIEALGGSIY